MYAVPFYEGFLFKKVMKDDFILKQDTNFYVADDTELKLVDKKEVLTFDNPFDCIDGLEDYFKKPDLHTQNKEAYDNYFSFLNTFGFDYTDNQYVEISYNKKRTKKYHNRKKFKVSPRIIKKHIDCETTIALKNFKYSKELKLDIDKLPYGNKQHKLNLVHNFIGDIVGKDAQKAYVEFNRNYTKCHIYIRLKTYITQAFKDLIIEMGNHENYKIPNIEIKNGDNDELRLPFSKQYYNRGYFYTDNKNQSKLKTIDISQNAIESINASLSVNFTECELTPKYKRAMNKFDTIKLASTRSDKKGSKILTDAEIAKKFPIGCGDRYKPMFAMACYLLSYDSTIEHFNKLLTITNKGSYDLSLSNSNALIDYTWECAKKSMNKPSGESSTSSIPSSGYIRQSYTFKQDERILIKYMIKKTINENNLYTRHKNIERAINDSVLLMQEIVGRLVYNKKNDNKYPDEFDFLDNSVALGQDLLKLIADELEIKNILKIRDILEASGLLKLVKDSLGRSYSYKGISYTKHFVVRLARKVSKLLGITSNSLFNYVTKYLSIDYNSIEYVDVIEEDIGMLLH